MGKVMTDKCQDCGTDEDVTDTTCPYAGDIHNKTVEVTLCGDCYYERVQSI